MKPISGCPVEGRGEGEGEGIKAFGDGISTDGEIFKL